MLLFGSMRRFGGVSIAVGFFDCIWATLFREAGKRNAATLLLTIDRKVSAPQGNLKNLSVYVLNMSREYARTPISSVLNPRIPPHCIPHPHPNHRRDHHIHHPRVCPPLGLPPLPPLSIFINRPGRHILQLGRRAKRLYELVRLIRPHPRQRRDPRKEEVAPEARVAAYARHAARELDKGLGAFVALGLVGREESGDLCGSGVKICVIGRRNHAVEEVAECGGGFNGYACTYAEVGCHLDQKC